jgi:hypothetical protein
MPHTGQMFDSSLPMELLMEIMKELEYPDLLSVRRVRGYIFGCCSISFLNRTNS